jgi:hypothetical protein
VAEADGDWRAAFDETMSTDPAVQVAGEEDVDLPEKIKEKLRLVPEAVKAEVRRAHHALGHVSRDALLRMAKAAKLSQDHLFYIRHWRCPVCLRRARPGPAPVVTAGEKAKEFNALVGVDLKEVQDVDGTRHTFLNVLDVATRYSSFILVPSKSSSIVAEAFMEGWIRAFGTPDMVIHDQGGEFSVISRR